MRDHGLGVRPLGERVLQEPIVITLGEVDALMRTAGLGAVQRAVHEGFADVQHVLQLEGRDELGVERPAAVGQSQAVDALRAKSYDGFLIAPSFVEEAKEFARYCQEQSLPFVFIDSNIENQPSLSYIGPPLFQSGYLGSRLCAFGMGTSNKVLLVNITRESSKECEQ
jgi:ABC-type sugar transport system substrate-binding protein